MTSWTIKSSDITQNSGNAIPKLIQSGKYCPNPSKEVIRLSLGDPSIGGYLKPPDVITNALCDIVQQGQFNGYELTTGMKVAREAVIEFLDWKDPNLCSDDIIMTLGTSSALDICIGTIANEGDNVLIPNPSFPMFSDLMRNYKIEAKRYDLLPDQNWEVNLRHLEGQINSKTKAILVNNPSNPCGSVFSKNHIQEILELAEKHCLPIIADEIYDKVVFSESKFISFASQSKNVPILSCSSISKSLLVPAWRLGWISIHDRNGLLRVESLIGI